MGRVNLKILDLFCGAGGAAMGYHQAADDLGIAHTITGVDIRPMPRYPFEFVQGDALEYLAAHGSEYDFIHASPPCQAYSEATPLNSRGNHPDLIEPVRRLLAAAARPYVIENVDGARYKLQNPIMLCGSMFGLKVWRHRWFETNPAPAFLTPPCRHDFSPVVVSGSAHGRGEATPAEMIEALGVPWMEIRAEARQAIPPAYTRYIGWQMFGAFA